MRAEVSIRAALAICLATLIAGCAAAGTPGVRRAVEPTLSCTYDVALTSIESAELVVRARCDGNQVRSFIASERVMAHHVRAQTSAGESIERRGASFRLPADAPADFSYRVNLDAVARQSADIDVAYKQGDAWVAALSTWILRPHPVARGAIAKLHVDTPPGASFATGLDRVGDSYRVRVHEIQYATYGVFGRFSRARFELPGPLAMSRKAKSHEHLEPCRPGAARSPASPRPVLGEAGRSAELARRSGETTPPATRPRASIEVVTLPGRLDSSQEALAKWVRDAALAVADFWHGFPVQRAVVVIVPAPLRDSVAYGKVVAGSGATVVVFVGSSARPSSLYADWILVHELFHLGLPSFGGEGKWLDEGLATYYEPIIRARAGWQQSEAVWQEFASEMHHGLRAVEQLGVERAQDYMGVYWGGAILALLADVRARKLTGGRLGLEDGLRAVLSAGGNATQLWPLDRVISVVDQRLGSPIMRELIDAHRYSGRPVDLHGLLRQLGVRQGGANVELDDSAPLAPVRRAIVASRP